MIIDSSSIPYIPGAKDYAGMGILPGGLHLNRDYRKDMVKVAPGVPQWMADILFDPQTSGGLLFSLPTSQAEKLVSELHDSGISSASVVGDVVEEPRGMIVVR